MNETLWITLPTSEENKIREILNLIKNKNLTSISINQLIEKLENDQAADWKEVLREYNAIPSVNNINISEILSRAESVRDKFELRGYPQLKNREFEPCKLLSLVILCYSNPVLIGPKLCKALNDNNNADVKKEMLENSAYRRSENRVLPSQSNLRLLSTALYFNDTSIMLPVDVINRVTSETIRDGRRVIKLDQRGGFEELIEGSARANGNDTVERMKRDGSEDSYAAWQSLQSMSDVPAVGVRSSQSQLNVPVSASPMSYSSNGSELTTEVLPLHATNTAAISNSSYLLVGSLVLFNIAKRSPVGAIAGNVVKDLVTAGKYVGGFFSKNAECEEQKQKTPLLSLGLKS